ncbi:MAG: hypothetical protein H0U76_13255 [Ktedonobacteraceae bacterium]|nr:hypothetical protein [Ktedonobacteraceae bacterium]
MKWTDEDQKRILLVLFLWLLLLMVVYLVLHNLYAFAALPTPPLLYFLPAFIYLLAGLLLGLWGLSYLRRSFIGMCTVLILSAVLLSLGVVFIVQGLVHFRFL